MEAQLTRTEAIVEQARSEFSDLTKQIEATYGESKARELLREATRQAQEEVGAQLRTQAELLDKKLKESARGIEGLMFPLKFPGDAYELNTEKQAREAKLTEAFRLAYALPINDITAFEQLLENGLVHTAFLYSERMDKVEMPEPERMAWEAKRNIAVQRYTKIPEAQREHKRLEKERKKIDRYLALMPNGSLFSIDKLRLIEATM